MFMTVARLYPKIEKHYWYDKEANTQVMFI